MGGNRKNIWVWDSRSRLYHYLINVMYITFCSYDLSYKTWMARLDIMINFMIYLYARQLWHVTNWRLHPLSNSEWYFSQCLFSLIIVCYVTLSKILCYFVQNPLSKFWYSCTYSWQIRLCTTNAPTYYPTEEPTTTFPFNNKRSTRIALK